MNERTLSRALSQHCRRMAAARWQSIPCTCGHVRGKTVDGLRRHADNCPRSRKRKDARAAIAHAQGVPNDLEAPATPVR